MVHHEQNVSLDLWNGIEFVGLLSKIKLQIAWTKSDKCFLLRRGRQFLPGPCGPPFKLLLPTGYLRRELLVSPAPTGIVEVLAVGEVCLYAKAGRMIVPTPSTSPAGSGPPTHRSGRMGNQL